MSEGRNAKTTRPAAVVLGVVMAAALLAGFPAAAAADTVTVHSGESIQAAIDAAPPGSVVSVESGTYSENVWITKEGITLRAAPGATPNLKAPADKAPGTPETCVDPEYPSAINGICVTGATGVRVNGFTVRQFSIGIFVVGASDTVIDDNRLIGNKEYGVFANHSTGSVIRANTATRSNDAGIYVGDSPDARATVQGNVVYDNAVGIFIRSASKGQIVNNHMHDNCVGLLFLDAPNPSTHWLAKGNTASNNNRTHGCEFTGVGIASLGSRDVTIRDNAVNNNQSPSFPGGGIAVFAGVVPGHPSTNVAVVRNRAHGNQPADLLWDGEGSVTFSANRCATSIPPGLCSL